MHLLLCFVCSIKFYSLYVDPCVNTGTFYLLQFEYQQAQLEAEVENLSWKVERAEITDRGVC